MAELMIPLSNNDLPAMDPLFYDIQAAEAAGCFPPGAESIRAPLFSTTAWSTKFHVLDEESRLDADEVSAIEKLLCSCDDSITYADDDDGCKVVTVCPSVEKLSKTEVAVKCPVKKCQVTLSNPSALGFHLQVHKIKILSDAEKYGKKREYACPAEECSYSVTGSKRFTARKFVKQHYLKVHAEKSHKCPRCSMAFGFFPAFTEHKKTCGQTYRCGMCPRTFLKPTSLTAHAAETGHVYDPFQLPSSAQSKSKTEAGKRYSTFASPNLPLVIIVNSAAGLIASPVQPSPHPSAPLASSSRPSPPLILPAPSSMKTSISPRREGDDPVSSGAALTAARALMDLSSTPIPVLARPQRADIAVQTCVGDFPESSGTGSGTGRRSRRSSPGRSSRKRTAQVQTKLTAPSKRRVRHSLVQTGAKSPSRAPVQPEEPLLLSGRVQESVVIDNGTSASHEPVNVSTSADGAGREPGSEQVIDMIDEVDTAIADILQSAAALAAERTDSPALNCEIDFQEMERLSSIIRMQNEQQLEQQQQQLQQIQQPPPNPDPPLAFVDACMSTEGFSSLDSYFSREIETQTDLDIFSDDFLSEFTSFSELDEMLSSSTQTLDWVDFNVDTSTAGGQLLDGNDSAVSFAGFDVPGVGLQQGTAWSSDIHGVELSSFPDAVGHG